MLPRSAIVAEARTWLGTPYRHQCSQRDAGCDCLGLVRGVWRALIGPEPEAIPAYTPDWVDHAGVETLHEAAVRWLAPIDGVVAPGDVLLFRMDAASPMKHLAILTDSETIVHAYWARAVVESRLSHWWRARIGAAFSFPGVQAWRS